MTHLNTVLKVLCKYPLTCCDVWCVFCPVYSVHAKATYNVLVLHAAALSDRDVSVAAMDHISAQTISNCWRHTGILPPTMSAEIASSDERERQRDNAAAAELSHLIHSLNLGSDALTAEEYEQFPGEQEVH